MGLDVDGLKRLKDNVVKSVEDGTLQEKLKDLAEEGIEAINNGIDEINNKMEGNSGAASGFSSSVKKEVPNVCPNCNAPLSLDFSEGKAKCPYCGTVIDIRKEKGTVDKIFDFVSEQADKTREMQAKELEERRLEREHRIEMRRRERPKRIIKRIIRLVVFLVIIYVAFSVLYELYASGDPQVVRLVDLINSSLKR